MTDPAAAGQIFIAAGDFAWMADILLRLVALFDTDLKSVTPGLGRRRTFTSAKAQSVLGWKPRPLEETVLDCARDLIATGVV